MPRDTKSVPPGMALNRYVPEDRLRWIQFEAKGNSGIHLIPGNDDRRHTCIPECFCVPEQNRHGVWIHVAFDCREEYEEGYRKKN